MALEDALGVVCLRFEVWLLCLGFFGILGFLESLELSEIGVFWVFKVLGLIKYLRIPLGDALGSRMPWECLGIFGNALESSLGD